MANRFCALFVVFGCAALVAGCGSITPSETSHYNPAIDVRPDADTGDSVFGEGGLSFFGGSSKRQDSAPAGIGVNAFLFRGSLETIAFMPITSADPFGGVILTDWYAPAETPNERFKVNIFILDRQLRADGIKATVFRQTGGEGHWVDAPVDVKTAANLENSILTRARQLRITSQQAAQQ